MKESGYIKVEREWFESPLYLEKREFSRWEAWESIMVNVNYADSAVMIEGKEYQCLKGQSLLSMGNWAKMWGWNKSKVNRFFQYLKEKKYIEIENLQVTTRITICNCDAYKRVRNVYEMCKTNELKSELKTKHLTICESVTYKGLRNANETQMKRVRNANETCAKTIEERKENNKGKEEKKEIQIQEQPVLPIKILEAKNTQQHKSIPGYIQKERIEGLKETVKKLEAKLPEEQPEIVKAKEVEQPIAYAYDDESFKEVFNDWLQLMKEIKPKYVLYPTTLKILNKKLAEMGLTAAIKSVEKSIEKGYDSFYEVESKDFNQKSSLKIDKNDKRTYKGVSFSQKIIVTKGSDYNRLIDATLGEYFERRFISGFLSHSGNYNNYEIYDRDYKYLNVPVNELCNDVALQFGFDKLETQIALAKKYSVMGGFELLWLRYKDRGMKYSQLHQAYYGTPMNQEDLDKFNQAYRTEELRKQYL